MTAPVSDERGLRVREEFPAAGEMIYLNTAAEGLGSATMERALLRYAEAKRRGSLGRAELAETGAAAKAGLARRLGCQAADLAFFGSTTEAINVVLRGLPWQSGDNVVITELEFPSAMIGCLSLAKQIGIEVRVVPHLEGDIALAAISGPIDARTRLVILSHVSFHSGTRFNLPDIVAAAHERGALVLIDASQSLGSVPVAAGDADFLVACPFKWLVASHGLGILYANPAAVEALPRHVFGWQGVTDFLAVMHDRDFTPHADARRFEAGMPSYPAIYALHDALELLETFEPPWIEERVRRHAGSIHELCRELGLHLLTPADPDRRAGIVAFADPRAQQIGDALAAQGVIAWYRDGRVRFSPHFYTGDADIQELREILPVVLDSLSATSGGDRVSARHR
jgi:selenocysteine lyase/cysteine desulfurase